jgi:hypothetical protein
MMASTWLGRLHSTCNERVSVPEKNGARVGRARTAV